MSLKSKKSLGKMSSTFYYLLTAHSRKSLVGIMTKSHYMIISEVQYLCLTTILEDFGGTGTGRNRGDFMLSLPEPISEICWPVNYPMYGCTRTLRADLVGLVSKQLNSSCLLYYCRGTFGLLGCYANGNHHPSCCQ